MQPEPMKPGDIIVCRSARGYAFTTGKEYTVVSYEKSYFDRDAPGGFTWPPYVEVIDDEGRNVKAHATRFVPKTEVPNG